MFEQSNLSKLVPTEMLAASIRLGYIAKGSALTGLELAAIVRGCLRKVMCARYLVVIRSAGYMCCVPDSICNAWIHRLMLELPGFEESLIDYEIKALG